MTLEKYRFFFPDSLLETQNLESGLASRKALHDKACFPAHVTTSAFLVENGMDRVLLIHHRALGRWLQPGGHYEPPAPLSGSAMRELREETGVARPDLHPWHERTNCPIDIDEHTIPAGDGRGEPAHIHIDMRYLFIARSAELKPNWKEVKEAAFFPIKALQPIAPRAYARILTLKGG